MTLCAALLILCLTAQAHAQWQSLNPGAGGQIQAVNLDPTTPGRAFYCSDMEGAYVTDDQGLHWRYIGRDLQDSHANWVSVDPSNPQRLYCGSKFGLNISDDGGEHWRAAQGIEAPIRCIVVNPKRPREIVASVGMRENMTEGQARDSGASGPMGVFVSRDGGASWTFSPFALGTGPRQTFSLCADPQNPETLYAAGLAGLFKSSDGARTWERITPPVVAHTSAGYGAAASNGTLHAKRLVRYSRRDRWTVIGGGPQRLAGLPNILYNDLVRDSHQPGRLFVATSIRGYGRSLTFRRCSMGAGIPRVRSPAARWAGHRA